MTNEDSQASYRCDLGWTDTSGTQWGCSHNATTQFGLASVCQQRCDDLAAIADRRRRGQ